MGRGTTGSTPRLIWSNWSHPEEDRLDLAEVGWFRPQYNHWFNGHHIGFHGGPKHGDVEYCEFPLHDVYRTVTQPEGAMFLVTADQLDALASVHFTYELYDLRRYARGGKPVHMVPMLMDDEVVWEEWVNPNYQEQYRYIHRE